MPFKKSQIYFENNLLLEWIFKILFSIKILLFLNLKTIFEEIISKAQYKCGPRILCMHFHWMTWLAFYLFGENGKKIK